MCTSIRTFQQHSPAKVESPDSSDGTQCNEVCDLVMCSRLHRLTPKILHNRNRQRFPSHRPHKGSNFLSGPRAIGNEKDHFQRGQMSLSAKRLIVLTESSSQYQIPGWCTLLGSARVQSEQEELSRNHTHMIVSLSRRR